MGQLWTPPAGSKFGRESVAVDAKQAQAWLDRNIDRNRPIKKMMVAQLMRAINAGKFIYDGSSIRFDVNGRLVDGQHRLCAIVVADPNRLPITLDVVYGLPVAAFDVIDSGASRSAADAISAHGHANTKALAAAVAILLCWDDQLGLVGLRNSKRNITEIIEFIEKNPLIVEAVAETSRRRALYRMCAPSVSAAATYLFMRVDRKAAEVFLDSIDSGADIPRNDGRLLLLRLMANYKTTSYSTGNGETRANALALWIKAWNLWRQNRTAALLAWKKGEQFPRPI